MSHELVLAKAKAKENKLFFTQRVFDKYQRRQLARVHTLGAHFTDEPALFFGVGAPKKKLDFTTSEKKLQR